VEALKRFFLFLFEINGSHSTPWDKS
jgi:hypothetical protein